MKIPNLLTAGRIVIAIVFFAVLGTWDVRQSPILEGGGTDAKLLLAAGLFVLAAITDALDGYLARRWNAVSTFGRIMDPFADKVLVLGAFVLLAGPGFVCQVQIPDAGPATRLGMKPAGETWAWSISGVQPWMVILILARELLVTSIRGVVEGQGGTFAATWSGKWKMILQCVCVPAVLVLLNVPPGNGESDVNWPWRAIQVIVGGTVLVTAWSGVPYVLRAMKALRTSKPVRAGAVRGESEGGTP